MKKYSRFSVTVSYKIEIYALWSSQRPPASVGLNLISYLRKAS